MDWKRAKIILIVVFTILNIVLAFAWYKNIKVEQVSQQTITNTGLIMAKNGINVECPIPKYKGKDYILQYEERPLKKSKIAEVLLGEGYVKSGNDTYTKDTNKLVFTSDSGFEYTGAGENSVKVYTDSKEGINAKFKVLASKMDLPFDEFKQDYYPDTKKVNERLLIYKGFFKGYEVFDNFIEIQVINKEIRGIKYQYKKPISITARRDINVIPVYQILITKMTKYQGIDICNVDMGFKGYTGVDKETKTLYEGLSWRIRNTDGKEFYFNARNGEEIK
ncbi:two-component system regulatory protein YycI [Clostridium sp. BNL1100]|uniref:two-component system regulatory protein YycI n=1 Tax=Clostridium sp. BNL1100 TaxID=755731 RepID=UPI00024A7FDE|nr:two-component system regulatory protein YycI [Clostridium sp. BNL1100]AEY68094.1 YycH protein [Clostridium sp. BNL1100]